MSYVIDRRLNGKNKSTVNRQRFLQRYRGHIKKAVEEAVGRRSITDMEHGEQISIPDATSMSRYFTTAAADARPSSTPATRSLSPASAFQGRRVAAVGRRPGQQQRRRHGRLRLSDHPRSFSTSCSRTWSCPTWSSVTLPARTPSDGTRRHRQRRQPVAHQHRPHCVRPMPAALRYRAAAVPSSGR